MKRGLKVVGIILGIILLLIFGFFILLHISQTTLTAVVVKVSDSSLLVEGITGSVSGLYYVGIPQKGIEFKEGQEIMISFDGYVMESAPPQLGKVNKIKIIKEKSDTEISKQSLQYAYSSHDNIKITVNELTNSGITLTIVDTNKFPYNYGHHYTIERKVKNPDYTGVGQKLGEDTENSIAGYTRNWSKVYFRRSKENF